jgi:PPOX class probable F420-dependent enzyme
MGRPMDDAERRGFLMAGTRTGMLATVRRDGSPHVAPIWFVLDGDDVVLTTGATTTKGRNLRRDPRACLAVDDPRPPFGFVRIDGEAELSDDPGAMLEWATRIAARYMGPDLAERYGRRNAVPGELLVRVRARRIVSEAGVAD